MSLNWNEIKSRALLFSKTWGDACREDSEAKPFWIDFFDIFGITNKRVATFEHHVKKLGGAQGFMDLFWPGVLLVEHKSRGKDLSQALDQAMGYLHHLSERDLPQLVVVCDFARFRVCRLASGKTLDTVEFELRHLHKHVKLFGLLAGYKVQDIRAEDPVNIKAAERMGRLHDALKASGYQGHALELLLVRLLFCLFADDTGIFQPAQSFRDFVEERTAPDGSDLGPRLGQLFQALNTPESQRSKHIDEQLGKFAYINGKLFEETLPMADFSTAIREALLDACTLGGVRGVLLSGWTDLSSAACQDVLRPAAAARTLLNVRNAPHVWLFKRVAAVVHHGGVGTTTAALAAGIPQVRARGASGQGRRCLRSRWMAGCSRVSDARPKWWYAGSATGASATADGRAARRYAGRRSETAERAISAARRADQRTQDARRGIASGSGKKR